jgi:hypothetical protein
VPNITFSRFVYLDTCIYSHLAKNRDLWGDLRGFLLDNDLCLALSDANVAELYDARTLHCALADLLLLMPSAMIKTRDMILDEEVEAHPKRRSAFLFFHPFNQLLLQNDGREVLVGLLGGKGSADARRRQVADARRVLSVHRRLKPNFSPSRSGHYRRQQADEFAAVIVMQWLADTHREFLKSFETRVQDLHTEVFLSLRLFALVNFYKYYLGRREPANLSDFGDEFHLAYIPYCELAIMERDLCSVLNQIRRHHDVLGSTAVRNIGFFEDAAWGGEVSREHG